MKIILTQAQVAVVAEAAALRNKGKDHLKWTKKWNKSGNYHFHGMLGEYAASLYLRSNMDLEYKQWGDDGFDIQTPLGTLDIKTVNYTPPILKITNLSDIKCDWLGLAYRESDTVIHLCGVVSQANFASNHYTRNFGFGNRFCMDEKNLEKFSVLKS